MNLLLRYISNSVSFCLLILIFLGIVIGIPHVLATPISVPLDHWSYHFIERFQAKGILKDYLSNTKPYTRDEMAKMILQIIKQVENGKLSLSKTENAQLDELKSEFARELGDLGVTGITKRKYLVDWSGDGKNFITQAGYTQDVSVKRGTEDYRIYKGTLQVLIQGDLKENLFFYSNNRASYEDSDEPRPIWVPYFSRYPWEAVSDSYLVFRLPWTDIQMGKDAILWGPGYDGVVGLAGVDPTFDIIKLPVELWKIKFTSILGFLRDDLGKQYLSEQIRKYISAHRIEVKPFSGFCIAWQEAYIYAENLHIELINPIMPYQMAEDYLGDVGNNTMEGDVDICLIPNTRFYASLFLDDLHSDKNPFTYGGFRWAALSGFLLIDPFGIDDTDFRAEYARVEPWTYPHKGIIQNPPIPTSYKHFNTPLGHWIGPNADDLFFEINHSFSKDLQTKLSYRRERKGEIGGSLYDYTNKAMGSEKRFLDGIVEKTQTLMLEMIYRIAWDSELNVSYSLTNIDNKQSEYAKLPSSFSTKQPWKSGQKWHQNVLKATLALKY
jgi:hypothetical protein